MTCNSALPFSLSRMKGANMRHRQILISALGFLLGAASNLLADGPTFTAIDFPGAATTQAWGINLSGDIVGNYVSADKSNHGFLKSRGQYSSIDFPGAAYTSTGSPPVTISGIMQLLDGNSRTMVLC